MLKKAKLLMLPTNEKAGSLLLHLKYNRLKLPKFFSQEDYKKDLQYWKHQHLYFLSDEEIKEGDWCLYKETVDGEQPFQMRKELLINKAWFKKIIATTDSSIACVKDVLSISQRKGLTNHYPTEKWILPQPSQSFLEVYVREYNRGSVIEEVLVEYETMRSADGSEEEIYLKTNAKDNTITIKRVKDSFNLQEMENALVKHYLDIGSTKGCNLGQDVRVWTKKWIEQNL